VAFIILGLCGVEFWLQSSKESKALDHEVSLPSATPASSSEHVTLEPMPTFAPPASRSAAVIQAMDYPDLQAAVDALPYPGGVVVLAPGEYRLKKPLDLTDHYNNGQKTRWIELRGSGEYSTTIVGNFPDSVIVDMSGSGNFVIEDLAIAGKARCMVLSARKEEAGGGGNTFKNVLVRGDDCEVGIDLMGSECNRFYNCMIYVSKPDAVALLFSAHNDLNIKSPYIENTGGSNTELRLYGCFIHSYGVNSVGLKVQGNANDVSIYGGYFASKGFAAIYLEGMKGNLGDVLISGLRVEAENGLYAIYARGAVRNVTLEGSCLGAAGEVVRYDAEGSTGWAEGWSIMHNSLTIQDQSRLVGSKSTAFNFPEPKGGRAILRLDRMVNCRIENNWIRAYRMVAKNSGAKRDGGAGSAAMGEVIDNGGLLAAADAQLEWYTPLTLVCSQSAIGNTIRVNKRSEVRFDGVARGNRIDALNDDGEVRRTYLGTGSSADLLNLNPVDVQAIKSPKTGDLAMDSGKLRKDGVPCLAYFNGLSWVPLVGEKPR